MFTSCVQNGGIGNLHPSLSGERGGSQDSGNSRVFSFTLYSNVKGKFTICMRVQWLSIEFRKNILQNIIFFSFFIIKTPKISHFQISAILWRSHLWQTFNIYRINLKYANSTCESLHMKILLKIYTLKSTIFYQYRKLRFYNFVHATYVFKP